MHIGLKYCGGCNCHYARIKEVEKLKKALPQHTFSYVAEHTVYDLVLLICGCMTACVETEGIGAKEFRFLRTPRDFTTVQQELATAITPTKREKKTPYPWGYSISHENISTNRYYIFCSPYGRYGQAAYRPGICQTLRLWPSCRSRCLCG